MRLAEDPDEFFSGGTGNAEFMTIEEAGGDDLEGLVAEQAPYQTSYKRLLDCKPQKYDSSNLL